MVTAVSTVEMSLLKSALTNCVDGGDSSILVSTITTLSRGFRENLNIGSVIAMKNHSEERIVDFTFKEISSKLHVTPWSLYLEIMEATVS